MKKTLLILAIALGSPALPAGAQQATEAQTQVLLDITKCLAAGLPDNWEEAEMLVELEKPGAETGNVRYVVRRRLSGGQYEPFRPCDERRAAQALVRDFRKLQTAKQRNWKGARFVIHRDGKFDLTFDYPK
jgi:hypothetical protein